MSATQTNPTEDLNRFDGDCDLAAARVESATAPTINTDEARRDAFSRAEYTATLAPIGHHR